MSEYKKVQPGEPMYNIIKAAKEAGQWICDAANHNDPKGCSNPKCFKYWQAPIHSVCPSCGRDKGLSVVVTESIGKKVIFVGFRCPCGRLAYHASPYTDEITELQWRIEKIRV